MNNFIILQHSARPELAVLFKAKVIDFERCGESIVVEGVHTKLKDLFGPIIKRNRIKCESCGEILESIFTNHYARCKCGLCKIDGGRTKLDRSQITGMYLEMSDFIVPRGLNLDRATLISMFRKV